MVEYKYDLHLDRYTYAFHDEKHWLQYPSILVENPPSTTGQQRSSSSMAQEKGPPTFFRATCMYLICSTTSPFSHLTHHFTSFISLSDLCRNIPEGLHVNPKAVSNPRHTQPVLPGPNVIFNTCFKRSIRSIKWRWSISIDIMSSAALREDNPSGTTGHLESDEKNGKDAERPGSTIRTYSRIAPAMSVLSDSDSDRVDLGRQMELEANSAIKYRICSWQKVCCRPLICSKPGGRT